MRCREKSMMEQRQELINPAPVVHRKSPSIRSAQIVSREKHECDEALAKLGRAVEACMKEAA